MNERELIGRLENLLFAAGDALPIGELAACFDSSEEELRAVVEKEAKRREADGCSLLIKLFAGRVQLATRAEFADMIYDVLGKKSAEELTRAMLETLSIVAYRQPVTRAEVEELRGVNSAYMLNALSDRGFVTEAGRKEVIGRPVLYVTTEKFLQHFDMRDLSELPQLPE